MMNTLHLWAFRDVLRRPFESWLLAATLTSTIAIVGTLLAFPRAVYDTVDKLLDATPSIVVRRVDATGWRPLPAQEALQAVKGVIGVVAARPRVWGVVAGPDGPLTIVGVQDGDLFETIADHLKEPPAPGQVILGSGVVPDVNTDTIEFEGAIRGSYKVVGLLPDETGIFTHDLVVLNIEDARRLLGLPEGYASDLAIEVFHADEQAAIQSDLQAAFPWPVRCTTRNQNAGIYASSLNRGSTVGVFATIPAVLAVCLLVVVNIRLSMGRQADLGIMKAVGWTTGDIARLQLYRALWVCLPAATVGVGLSSLLVYWPGATWMAMAVLGWETIPPKLFLAPEGAVMVLLEVAGLILAPVIASALAPAIKGATADVHQLIQGAGDR